MVRKSKSPRWVFKTRRVLDYIQNVIPTLLPCMMKSIAREIEVIFGHLENQAAQMSKKYDCPFVDNELPYGRAEPAIL